MHGGGGLRVDEVTWLGGVTRHIVAHPSVVPYLHVNRPQTRHFYEKTLFNFLTVTVTSSS